LVFFFSISVIFRGEKVERFKWSCFLFFRSGREYPLAFFPKIVQDEEGGSEGIRKRGRKIKEIGKIMG